ncbi:GNAT family N-acetyltransferase [Spirosoma rhododendri]|uniref:GNAT family N-acetyltransferase n=1 Tax=Spirosoma rhododendri TaxID=2728024 RepID=A0A7L5DTP9_9BACT|nr:GNAT family N-acetyltransferase [Spirosoma rhododendri]QJD80831.1 GNAT family N-acetyltransferase [Spirosoma rhododendri]
MTNFTIAVAASADVPELNQLVNSAYRGDSSRQGWTTEADLLDGQRTSEADLLDLLSKPAGQILTYRVGGKLLGCVYLEQTGKKGYLGMLTVAPDVQTAGIGKRLLAEAEAVGRAAGCQTITMTVLTQRHELIAWYERRGYQSTGVTKPFPDDPRFGLPKQPLTFVFLSKSLV